MYLTAGSTTCRLCAIDKPAEIPQETELSPPDLPLIAAQPPVLTEEFKSIIAEGDYNSPTVKELASRVLARRRLLPFIKRFRPNYLAGWVHEDICRRLERFMEAVERKESPRMLLCMPVRMGKSEIGSRHFAPWLLGHHPDWEVIAASGGQGLALTFSRYIRDLMRDASYQALFPNSVLSSSSQSVENWSTTAGGGYMAAGVGTMIVGRGCHILLIDDPCVSPEAADSPVQREAIWSWYIGAALNRVAPGGGVLGILTHWHEDDWAGRVQQVSEMGEGADKFEVVKYPAVNDQGDEYILADDTIVQIAPGRPVPEGARMTRPMNSALHPDRYTMKMLMNTKATYSAGGQQRWWSALYQQNPTPEDGAYFTKEMLKTYTHRPKLLGRNLYMAFDFAVTDKAKSDWNVGIVVLQDEYNSLFVLDMLRFRSDDGIEIVGAIVDYAKQWSLVELNGMLGVEDGQIWKSLASTFKVTCEERQYYPSHEVLVPLTDKMARAQPLRGRMQAGKVFFPERAAWFEILKKEFLQFPSGKHDDIVDALAWAVRLTLARSAPKPVEVKPLKSWKDDLKLLMNGQGGTSHMAA